MKRKKPINIMQRRGLVRRGVPLETKVVVDKHGKRRVVPATAFRKQPVIVPVEKAPKKGFLYRTAGAVGWGIQKAENIKRMFKGQARRVMFEPEFVGKLRVVKVQGETLHISPYGYLPYIKRVRFTEKLPAKLKALLVKKRKLLSTTPFLMGYGAGVLSLGGKYIIIPQRPMTVGVHPGKFHWVAGMGDYYKFAKGRKHEMPHETAHREVIEEIGGKVNTSPTWFTAGKVAKELGRVGKNIQFLGQGLKPVKTKDAPALIMLQDLNINMFEVHHAVDIKMSKPDKFIEDNFKKVGEFKDKKLKGGLFKFSEKAKVEDKWEMAQAAIFPRDSKSIFYFVRSHRGQITDAARLGLLAYAAELRKIEKKK